MSDHIQGAKQALLRAALDYARAVTFNRVLTPDGKWNAWALTDKQMYHDHYLKALGQAAVFLLEELTTADAGVMP